MALSWALPLVPPAPAAQPPLSHLHLRAFAQKSPVAPYSSETWVQGPDLVLTLFLTSALTNPLMHLPPPSPHPPGPLGRGPFSELDIMLSSLGSWCSLSKAFPFPAKKIPQPLAQKSLALRNLPGSLVSRGQGCRGGARLGTMLLAPGAPSGESDICLTALPTRPSLGGEPLSRGSGGQEGDTLTLRWTTAGAGIWVLPPAPGTPGKARQQCWKAWSVPGSFC